MNSMPLHAQVPRSALILLTSPYLSSLNLYLPHTALILHNLLLSLHLVQLVPFEARGLQTQVIGVVLQLHVVGAHVQNHRHDSVRRNPARSAVQRQLANFLFYFIFWKGCVCFCII